MMITFVAAVAGKNNDKEPFFHEFNNTVKIIRFLVFGRPPTTIIPVEFGSAGGLMG